MTLLKVMLGALGCVVLFAVLLDGYFRALEEVAGKALADHAVRFCPNWLLGMATGAFGVGLAWWCVSTSRRSP